MLDVASSLTRSWINLYTRGLPDDQRETRMSEIESDLWEHRNSDAELGIGPADTGFEVLTRFMSGIPADLLWRRTVASAGRAATSPRSLMNMKGSQMKRFMAGLAPVLVIALGVFQTVNGVGILLSVEEETVWGLMELATGILLLTGLYVTRRSPRLGSGIIIATVVVAAGFHFWMAFIAFPVALVITATILVRTHRGPATSLPS